ncbi:TBCK protein kinase [Pelomyxa schiedti]|nr:TBCK protein kinase [Pelomyxa schiedti]
MICSRNRLECDQDAALLLCHHNAPLCISIADTRGIFSFSNKCPTRGTRDRPGARAQVNIYARGTAFNWVCSGVVPINLSPETCTFRLAIKSISDEAALSLGMSSLGVQAFPVRMTRVVPISREKHTPASIIVGRFHSKIKTLRHPHLCEYVDVLRGKYNRMIIVSEHYPKSLRNLLEESDGNGLPESEVIKFLWGILSALSFLAEHHITVRNLSLETVVIDKDRALLSDWGLFFLTDNGSKVDFVIGEPHYLSPEAIATGPHGPTDPKVDVWALGVVAVSLLVGHRLWDSAALKPNNRPNIILQKILQLAGHDIQASPLGTPEQETFFAKGNSRIDAWLSTEALLGKNQNVWPSLSPPFQNLLRSCFELDSRKRPSAFQLQMQPIFARFGAAPLPSELWAKKPHLWCLSMSDDGYVPPHEPSQHPVHRDGKPFTCGELFYVWKLRGGNLENELAQIPQPVLRIPHIWHNTPGSGCSPQHTLQDTCLLYSAQITLINLDSLFYYLLRTPALSLESLADPTPQLSSDSFSSRTASPPGRSHSPLSSASPARSPTPTSTTSTTPFGGDLGDNYYKMSRYCEKTWGNTSVPDVDYLVFRVELFRELIQRYKYCRTTDNAVREETIRQASIDIPSCLRREIWCVILGVRDDTCGELYHKYNNFIEGPSDKQIDLDIPRCHQYQQLLASPQGHTRLRNVLHAWVKANPQLTYWQGLDSILAPFIALSCSEAQAFMCLNNFVLHYAQKFFERDNSLFLQSYLLTFRQLVAFHDAALAVHLHEIGFHPHLYAISWFLTQFTYIFPLERVYPLWDKILLGTPSFPFFIALEIMLQLRDTILPLSFENCITLFSNLPDIDMERCISQALIRSSETPLSITMNPSLPSSRDSLHECLPWWRKPIPLDERMGELAPRISLQDLVILAYDGVVLDIRPPTEYGMYHFPNSVCVGAMKQKALSQYFDQLKGPVVVIGSGSEAPKFANSLILDHNINKVTVLNGGIECLKVEAESMLERTRTPSKESVTSFPMVP